MNALIISLLVRADAKVERDIIPIVEMPRIYGAIAFYLDHQADVRRYLKQEERRMQESNVPLSEADPELWSRLQRAREELTKPRQ